MKKEKAVLFSLLSVGDEFTTSAGKWKKQSSRTAKPLFQAFAGYYYFGQNERVFVKRLVK